MKKNEIVIHGGSRKVSTLGKAVLRNLRDSWGAKEIEREVVVKDEKTGEPIWGKEVVLLESPNRRLNKGIDKERFYLFADLIKTEEDVRNINSIIDAGCFEVEKAISAFKTGPEIAVDRSVVVSSFEQGVELGAPTMATLVKYKGEQKASDLIYMMIVNFAKKFGKRNDLSEGDILELSFDVVNQFKGLSVADIKMVFNDALFVSKKMFNLDYAGVLGLLNECKEDRMDWAMKKQIEEHRQLTSIEKGRREKKEVKLSGEGLSMEEMKKEIKLQEEMRKK